MSAVKAISSNKYTLTHSLSQKFKRNLRNNQIIHSSQTFVLTKIL